jgi:hypothetical protein
MANVPQEPLEQSEAERLRAARRAEREEARRQKKELARIEREMRGPGPRWVLPVILGSLVLVALLGFLGYRFVRGARIANARVPFEESYAKADKNLLQTYAAGDWQRVQELKRKAESGKGGAGAIIKAYQDADKLLETALIAANDAASRVEFARTTFDSRYEQAVKLGVGELLPSIWKRVEEARSKAMEPGVSGDESAKYYKAGSDILDDLDFTQIGSFQEVAKRFKAATSTFSVEEYAKAFPEESKGYQASVKAAQDAIARQDWKAAMAAYQKLLVEVPTVVKKLREAKIAASKATAELDKALLTAKGQGAPRDAEATWLELQKERQAVNALMADMDYNAATEKAAAATAKVKEMLAQIAEARGSLQQNMQKAEQAYQAALADKTFLGANLAEKWQKVKDDYEEMRKAVAAKEDIVSLLKRAQQLTEEAGKLVEEKSEMLAGLTAVRDKLAVLQNDPVSELLSLNTPKQNSEILRTAQEAERAEKRGEIQTAVAKYKVWIQQLGKAIVDVKKMRRKAISDGQSCGERILRFKKGIAGFRSEYQPEINRLRARFLTLMKRQDFRQALPVLADLEKLVPDQRFTFDKPGTVTDNEAGLMWASDGKGPGCLGGKKVNWHEAFRWADELSFAGYRDWRLPSEEELQLIGKISAKERARAFPNTPVSIYWTNLPDTDDANQALAVDLRAVRTVLRPKNLPFYVRAIRYPTQ